MAYEVLKNAIESKSAVRCFYHGLVREVCPHVIGQKNGHDKVLCFQFGGDSSKGLPPGGEWRCMFVDQISGAEEISGPWKTGTGHSKPQTCVDDIDAEVDF